MHMIGDRSGMIGINEDTNELTAYLSGRKIWSQDLGQLFFSSSGRPWGFGRAQKMKRADSLDGGILLTYSGKGISAGLKVTFDGGFRISLEVKNISGHAIRDFCCGITLRICSTEEQKVTIPHLIYNDNPSSDPARTVPHIGKEEGLGLIAEEHRLPIPAVNLEWGAGSGAEYVTLLSVPAVASGEDLDYWGLGALYGDGGKAHTLVLTNGPLMFNGIKDMVYGGQGVPLPYDRGYRTILPDETISRSFIIDFGETAPGRGFRHMVDLAYRSLVPESQQCHSYLKMAEYKSMVADTRYLETEDAAGYRCFGDANSFGDISGRPPYFLYAWTGQALKIAWSEMRYAEITGDLERFERAFRTVDFFVKGTEQETPGLLRCYYTVPGKAWGGSWDDTEADLSSRMQGEALSDLMDILELLKENGKTVPPEWEKLAERACGFLRSGSALLPCGIYPLAWLRDGKPSDDSVSTAGAACVLALVKSYLYRGDRRDLEAAEKVFARYYDLHMKTFDRPFSRATFDAKCEDKEAGIYVFCSAALLYRATGNRFYREAADDAGDWLLTFVYFWDTGFLPGSQCAEKGFRTTGWPGVSVQNHHLDVFFPAWEMYEYGKDTGNVRFSHMGMCVAKALTQGVCTHPGEWGFSVVGEQGEQYYHTNYVQCWYPEILKNTDFWRGRMRPWNPSWITAQIYQSALRFASETEAEDKENK
ncbi:MAG: hypothetical protein IJU57_01645 [Clostridia bacterium]|nr:hypothetical protein [Clostridia bacterium]